VAVEAKVITWDSYLDEAARLHVETYRQHEWPNIRRELAKAPYNITLHDGLEPCWVTPGKAIYWQEQVMRRPVTKQDEQGRSYQVMEDFSDGYAETAPFPANNASVIAYNLRKGLRLRPLGQEGVEAEDTASLEEPTEPKQIFTCYRHGYDRKAFATWKGYLHHCRYYREAPECEAPDEVKARAALFVWYCFYHDKGFNNQAGATRHMRTELKKPGKPFHLTLEQMNMKDNQDG
jgi:hypothetical protein